ncbi:MAG: hypothetical protein LBI10_00575 [Deltaproteobacteria bacterium]|jgi:hypothetical protein|nr:hypothetical protein [Deltaproteobacteria bacterium]
MTTTRPKTLAVLIFLALGFLFSLVFISSASLAAPEEVLDLEKWAKAGLPAAVRERMVIQSLSQRARPPLSGDFLLAIVRYGGEGLALRYMSLDSATENQKEAPLSPEVVSRLMSLGAPRADLERIIELAANQTDPSGPVPTPVALRPVTEITVENLDPVQTEIAGPQKSPSVQKPLAPEPPPSFKAATSPTREELRRVPQTLVPGQPADPARPMPPAPGPYQIRKPQGSRGVFMGVQEEVKPDGHVYRINTNGRKEFLGAEVISRPSGHKIHRYFSGRTDQTRPDYPPKSELDYGEIGEEW